MNLPARVAIATEEPGWHGAELRRSLLTRRIEPRFLSLRSCRLDLVGTSSSVVLPGFADGLPDGMMVRDVPGGTLEQVVLRPDLLHALRELGVRVYNDARAIERTVDKALTSFLLRRAGLPCPPTCVTEAPEEARAFLVSETASGNDVVAKPLFGSLGVGLRRLGAGTALPDAAGGVWYLQRYVDTGAAGEGWRAFRVLVVGGTAAAAVGADHAGVDLIRDRSGGLQVLEVNGIPAWRGLQGTTRLDLAELVAADFLSRIAS